MYKQIITAFRVTDNKGDICRGYYFELEDNVFVTGVLNKFGIPITFDSEAKHLREWSKSEGVTLQTESVTIKTSI